MTPLENALLAPKLSLTKGSIDLYLEVLKDYPEDEWFSCCNSAHRSDYTAMEDLFEFGLIGRKSFPVRSGNNFTGRKTEFFFRWDLNYENL